MSNFGFLSSHDPLFLRLAEGAERAFVADPATTVVKLRQLGEAFAQHAGAALGLYAGPDGNQLELLRSLESRGIIDGPAKDLFHQLRRAGNRAVHEFSADHKIALEQLRMARQLAIWFHRTFGGAGGKSFKPGPFVPPEDPNAKLLAIQQEVHGLRAELSEREEKLRLKESLAAAEAAERAAAEAAAERARAEQAEWEALAATLQAEANAARQQFQALLAQTQAAAQAAEAQGERELAAAAVAASASLELSEEETRLIIDDQLRAAGWEADSQLLRHAAGARPEKSKNRAIAEWPTRSGRADYVLFVGLVPVGIVEAKKQAVNVPGVLEQAKRYACDYRLDADQTRAPGARVFRQGPGGASLTQHGDAEVAGWYAREEAGRVVTYQVPFLFATNGRPYHRQLETESGVWFLDARDPKNHGHPLTGWHTPQGLMERLEQDAAAAAAALAEEPTEYLRLRDYQLAAIRAVEEAIAAGRREVLVAMATGTGKTKTIIGLIYRLLKTKRFRRVLFLVDRSALGEQAAAAFADMRLEQDQTFTQIFEVKSLGDLVPDTSTRVHLATVQSLVRRALFPGSDAEPVPVDRYDLVIVDESHRGYTLDREMTEGELELRAFTEYVSLYRRVLDHFDAVKVGLTATPALHTREIFGPPVFTYSYREAVVDGYLIDHEPPVRLVTHLAKHGIHFAKGDQVKVAKPGGDVQLSLLPDEMSFEVKDFNKKVKAPKFTEVVCEVIAPYLDPTSPEKSLIFCVDDEHADDVVAALKKAMVAQWGPIEEEAIKKITGATDRCLEQIRRYKNEKQPSIAVTVDLLTTGIDVPAIGNLVFIRRVRSRILYEQMLGRATRRCDPIGKEVFRVFDAVDLYAALEEVSQMKPVVTSPEVGLDALLEELGQEKAAALPGQDGKSHGHDVLQQVLGRLRRAARRLARLPERTPALQEALGNLAALAGGGLDELATQLKKAGPEGAQQLLTQKPGLAKVLLQVFALLPGAGGGGKILSDDSDHIVDVGRGYGKAQRPEDYLDAFGRFLREQQNHITALQVVLTRPRDLTRADLRALRLVLAEAGYTETALRTAYKEAKNVDIAASIIGFIRQQALGSSLLPYEQRVKRALQKVLAMQPWSPGQRAWLERIGKQLAKEVIVDEEAFRSGAFENSGGFKEVDKRLGGKLKQVLDAFGDAIWDDQAA